LEYASNPDSNVKIVTSDWLLHCALEGWTQGSEELYPVPPFNSTAHSRSVLVGSKETTSLTSSSSSSSSSSFSAATAATTTTDLLSHSEPLNDSAQQVEMLPPNNRDMTNDDNDNDRGMKSAADGGDDNSNNSASLIVDNNIDNNMDGAVQEKKGEEEEEEEEEEEVCKEISIQVFRAPRSRAQPKSAEEPKGKKAKLARNVEQHEEVHVCFLFLFLKSFFLSFFP
jgi:hypothetical protein